MREAVSTLTPSFEKLHSAQQAHPTIWPVSDYDHLRIKENKYYFFHLSVLVFQMSAKLLGHKDSQNCLILTA